MYPETTMSPSRFNTLLTKHRTADDFQGKKKKLTRLCKNPPETYSAATLRDLRKKKIDNNVKSRF